MRRRLAVFWLALILWFSGIAGLCLAQDSPPDIAQLTQRAQAGDLNAMMALGDAYIEGSRVKRDLDAAIGWFARVAQTNDANALYQLSYALRERNNPGDLDLAVRYGLAASVRAKRSGTAAFQAAIQIQLGYAYDALSRFEEAIAAYESARRLTERAGSKNSLQVVAIYLNLANALSGAGREDESAAASDKAIKVLTTLPEGNSELMADLHTNRAISLINIARYGEALNDLDAALVIYQQQGGPGNLGAANVLKTKSRAYSLLARYKEAIEVAQSALAIYDKTHPIDYKGMASARGMLGLAYQGLRSYDAARDQYLTAKQILEDNGAKNSIEMMNPLTNLGNVEDELGQYEDALVNYRRALALLVPVLGADHPDVATMLGRLGNTSKHFKQYDAALDYGLRALLIQINAKDADVDSQRYTLRMLAYTLAAKKDRNAAMLFAKLAVNAHQALRSRNSTLPSELRSALGQTFQPSYRLLSELLLSDGQFAEAQFAGGMLKQEEIVESTPSSGPERARKDDVEPGIIRLTKGEAQIWNRIQELSAPAQQIAVELHGLTARLKNTGTASPEITTRLHELATGQEKAARQFASSVLELIGSSQTQLLLRQKENLDAGQKYVQSIQSDLSLMGRNVVLLQAMSLEDQLHLFLTVAGQPTVHRQVPVSRADLANKVSATVAAVEDRHEDAARRLAELYDLLIRPVRSDLDAAVQRDNATTPTLLLDLSGFLRYVPYAALYDGRHYLVEDFAPALYNPAARVTFRPMRRDNIKAAGFAVTRQHNDFPALPGASKEIEALFRVVNGTARLDDDFNEDSFAKALAAKPQLLHIASHFRFRPGNETNSYMLLGDGDGITLDQLRTQKKYKLNGIDLITLSACETARGGGAEGEEIESFGALAQTKGASAVMSTLWQIADDSTAQLMSDFYDGLINRGLDKAHALQQAQLALIKGETAQQLVQNTSRAMTVVEDSAANGQSNTAPTSQPYYWAAFILMGNWM